ncbi:PHB depolymerase family esterase [Amycolatopsis sp. SID8362]|uniref:extracellular catalytic domain type 1 short-chain-length polyhydroxyalkanoate depolymerase n=1 Tax=Amycolatopsis sp. SID8362 TaxID=2690346 RepID=UPI00136CBB2A|nr:PHB depolymerase family esterase [Amycolatopsis sp. SID8362]NBH06002.1 PHB depolymerase family esterase [Amycolatopsis sp. SID8362]NED42700.1 PHB depolymerase family esterase [Amycolatopsis sp. SID8362]
MAGLKTTLAAVLLLAVTGIAAPPAAAASLVEVTGFGDNPGGMRMHVYVPDSHPARPAVVVAMHGCGGSGPGFYSGSEFASLADRYGFLVIYPSAEQEAGFGKCFDTWSDAAKHRGGGSDPVSIVSMVTYAEQHYGADPDRVFATGSSSGGMMTNEMLALYPDVFRAGAAFMGVPFDCFAGAADYPPGTSKCTGGSMNRTPQQWGDAVRQAYPGYSGLRPRVQLWHGTADTLVPYSLLQEEIEQWTDVFGLSQTPTATDTPQPGWQRRRYGDTVEAYSIEGAGHSLPSTGMAARAIAFFGLTGTVTDPAGSCAVAATVSAWNTGLTENITITNTGSAPIDGWSLAFTLPAGQRITSGWGATYAPASGQVTARNAAYNPVLAPNASTTIGFQATHTGDPAAPTAFALNGAACSVR